MTDTASQRGAQSSGRDRAATWFHRGVTLVREGKTKDAARAFGMAHHAEHRLENAALLTFACLKAREGDDSDLVEQLINTWLEAGSTPVTRTRTDAAMLASLDTADEKVVPLSPLGHLAWAVLGSEAREKLHDRFRPAADNPLSQLFVHESSSDT